MRRVADIHLIDDRIMQQYMVWLSMAILAVGALVGVFGAIVLPHEELGLQWFVTLVVASVAILPVHELLHAAAFAVFTGFRAHIRFGFTDWMLYTSAAGTLLRRRDFCAVLLAPVVLITIASLAICAFLGVPLLGWFLSVIHLAGCTGDLAYVHIIAREPMATHVEDTEYGIALFYDE